MQSACRRIPRKGSVVAYRRAKGDRRWSWVRVVVLFAREGTEEYCEEGGKSVEWEDWVYGPRYRYRIKVGSPPLISLLLVFSRERYSAGRRKMRGTRGTWDEEVGRPTTPPGACPESIRMVYHARLITSRGCTAVFYNRRFLFKLFVRQIGGPIVQVVISTLNAEKVSTIKAYKSAMMLLLAEIGCQIRNHLRKYIIETTQHYLSLWQIVYQNI